jgi:hypothetical protein
VSASRRGTLADARRALAKEGLLLEADARLPSLTTVIAGAPVRGSWWGHPAGEAIFHAFGALLDDEGVALARLVNGKVTIVHPRLVPALLAVGTGGEAWQTERLSAPARRLLARVRREGAVRASGDAPRELETRLLVRAHQVHTESGAHEKAVTTWARWAEEEGVAEAPPLAEAKASFEAVARAWEAKTSVPARLPWEGGRPAAGRRPRRSSSTGR